MAVTAYRVIGITFSGDVDAPNLAYAAGINESSPGSIAVTDLVSGANTITVPSDATAVTILPPAANTIGVTLKGITGDTGIVLHLTDPSSLAIASSVTSFVLTAADALPGVRLVWS